MHKIILEENSPATGKRIVELAVPVTVNILAIKRNAVYITPNGSTKLLADDILFVLTEEKSQLVFLENAVDRDKKAEQDHM